ncbi:MAG TPA: hypothetical protein PKY40_15545, partial [Burkholderiaceae bacterium]|nr:hypothetical protein [Burkholderiaceae bacterium]
APSWTAVGGDNPTSPVTGLDLTVPAGTTRWARVYLEPKADATKSATPILSALRFTHEPTGAAFVPRRQGFVRRGPILVPMGVM